MNKKGKKSTCGGLFSVCADTPKMKFSLSDACGFLFPILVDNGKIG